MEVRFIGSGDAFGSGGRFNTCIQVAAARTSFLIDCGASSLVAMRAQDVDPNAVAAVFVSHGDHFGGLPFFILDAQFYSRRRAPLTLVGPPGFHERLTCAMETFFPGSAHAPRKFETVVREIAPGEAAEIDGISVEAFEVAHACGAPPLALRFVIDDRIVAYSGDTEWTETLLAAGRDADLFIMEALTYAKRIPQHLDYTSIVANAPRLSAKRIVLTHLGPDMLENRNRSIFEIAEDGLVLSL